MIKFYNSCVEKAREYKNINIHLHIIQFIGFHYL